MKQMQSITKLERGDQVAVISPSSGLPGLFPSVFELGLERLESVFGLKPKEYPTTRQMHSSHEDRVRDIHAAFSDTNNKAVIASIGGEDQLLLIKMLNKNVFSQNPKPFLGFSDNTHMHNFLWSLGIPSFYGGSIMTQFGMTNEMDAMTVEFIKKALFDGGKAIVTPSLYFKDIGLDWSDESNLKKERFREKSEGYFWYGDKKARGQLWGGCIESLYYQTAVGQFLPTKQDLKGCILFIESAEDIPDHWVVEYLLNGFGERGWFDVLKGVMVGRPKAWEFDKQRNDEERRTYRKMQRETVVTAVRKYNSTIPIVQNVDFGHTDPQILLPYGGEVEIDPLDQKLVVFY